MQSPGPGDDRWIPLSLDDLRRIPLVIALAAEPAECLAVVGALRTGAINALVTERQNALTVLRLAAVTDLQEESMLLGETPGYS